MRIKNPNAPALVSDTDKADLNAALLALASSVAPTADEIRAAMPAAKRAKFTEAFMQQVALEAGLSVLVE